MSGLEVNYLAILVAAIVNMVVGAMWYAPAFFGKKWAAGLGWDEAKMKAMQKEGNNGKSYVINFIAALVMAYVFAHILNGWQTATISEGLQAGFWVWLGLVATAMIGSVLWERKSWNFYAINTGYYLVVLLINGVLLTIWS